MRQENPTLSIKDIVLLKERPQDYYKLQDRLTKTHDGTSSGAIRGHFQSFIEEFNDSPYRAERLISSDGEILDDFTSPTDIEHNEWRCYDEEDLLKYNQTGMHILCQDSYETSERGINNLNYVHDENEWSSVDFFEEQEMDYLTMKNDDGEYLVQSVTKVNASGTETLTMIKNNDFDEVEFEPIKDAMNYDLYKRNQQRNKEIERRRDDYALNNGYKSWLDIPSEERDAVRSQILNDVNKEYGQLKDYIDSEWGPQLEEAGVKLKFQKNNNINVDNIIDSSKYSEYVETWMDIHEEPFNDDYGDSLDDLYPSLADARRIYDQNMSSPHWGGDGT